MCLGVPGRIEEIMESDDPLFLTGKVSFAGVLRDVNLAGIREPEVGEWVIVHAGFALNRLNEEEASEVFRYLEQMAHFARDELDGPTLHGKGPQE